MSFLQKSIRQNILISKPFWGGLFLAIFFFIFCLLYRPFEFDHNTHLNFTLSILIYGLIGGLSYWLFIVFVKRTARSFFCNWNLQKELLIIFVSLLVISIVVFSMGYVLNVKRPPVRISGILDIIRMITLIAGIPFAVIIIVNINKRDKTTIDSKCKHTVVRIQSALKESVDIVIENLIYIISDGNYVDFYLLETNKVVKKTIRNSLNNIEQQLSSYSFCVRTHRAFIVNINYVVSKTGNVSGYKLKMKDIDTAIPVSRKRIEYFDMISEKYYSEN
ncbi:MAG: LytTR family transcriptional regulator [Bacteroidales bacterium]|nr:LytTR family transcriptional regulator [Bacteroidales bacterium]